MKKNTKKNESEGKFLVARINGRFLAFCLQCGYAWHARSATPVKCPNRKCTNPFYWFLKPVEKKKGDKE
jgi:hypothetical protein